MALEITARLIQKLNVQSGTSARGPWSKQEFVVETQESYPRKVCLSVFGEDKVKDLASFQEGDVLTISINLESREYNGRWYTDARAWRIVRQGDTPAQGQAQGQASTPAMPPVPPAGMISASDSLTEQEDDLPF